MTEKTQVAPTDDSSTTSRRAALRMTGGGLAIALAATRFGGRASAQGAATPTADESRIGSYAVVRTRKVKPDADIEALSEAISEGLMPKIEELPGFVDYFVIQNYETLERSSISIFDDKAGTDASTKLAGEFLNGQGLAGYYEDVNPVITEGEIVVASEDE